MIPFNENFDSESPVGNPLIDLQNLNVSLGGKRILSNIEWRMKSGENWAFLGGNGSGKTTLMRLIRGEIWPDPCSLGKRIYCLNGETQTAPIGIRERVPVVSADLQDAYTRHHWNLSGEDLIYTGFTNSVWLFRKPNADQLELVDRTIDSLGIAHLRKRSFLELSRGEARKILIARAIVTSPPIMVLDEFCNGLDIETRQEMFDFMENVVQGGTQLIYITHRMEELIPSVSHILWLEKGRIIHQGERNRVIAAMQFPGHVPQVPCSLPEFSPPRIGEKTKTVMKMSRFKDPTKALIRIRNADVYRKDRLVLYQIDWRMKADENWAVLGKNGSGKSTFLSLLYGDLHPALGGDIRRFDWVDGEASIWEIKKKIGYLSAHLQADYEYNLTGEEAVQSGAFSSVGLWDEVTDEIRHRASRWIEFFHIEDLAQQDIYTMSYGQLRKILLARAMMNDPKILLLDEPCNGLDRSSKADYLALLESLSQTHTRLVFVTHHPEELIPSITHTLFLEEGRIIAQGARV